MSRCLVFLPGIMGSELVDVNNKQIWPPSGLDLVTGYSHVQDLLNPHLKATKAIRSILFVHGVYKPLIEDFNECGYFHNYPTRELIEFAYDWRLSNTVTAAKLADRLDEIVDQTEIILIGHSMGGLVLRYLLESGEFNERHWFGWIKQLITLGTPHKGAPEALRQVLGLEEKAKLSRKDIKKLTSDSRYTSAFQLTPDPQSALTLIRNERGQLPSAIETFAAEVLNLPNAELNNENIKSAKHFWNTININNKPEKISYFFFGGAAHKTFVRNEISGNELTSPERKNSGDGTVPITSAIFSDIPHGYSMKNHGSIFTDRNLRTKLYHMLEAPRGTVPFSAKREAVGKPNRIGISLNKDNYALDELIELVISYTEAKTDPIESFSIAKIDVANSESDNIVYENRDYKSFTILFNGVGLLDANYQLDLGLGVGYYELIANSKNDDPLPTFFTVME